MPSKKYLIELSLKNSSKENFLLIIVDRGKFAKKCLLKHKLHFDNEIYEIEIAK